jgi:Ca2+/Na+ antiporter
MAAFTTGLVLSDLIFYRTDRVISHLFLGGISTALFFVLCQRGFEIVNWVLLLIVPVYMFLVFITSSAKSVIQYEHEEHEEHEEREKRTTCNTCHRARSRCGCRYKDTPEPKKMCGK